MKIIIYTKEKKYGFKSIFDKDYNYVIRHAHREDGPAIIWYGKNGNIEFESWYLNEKLHRKDGPAFITYNNNNNSIYYKKYYLNGKYYSEDKFNQILLKKKIKLF